MTQEHGYEVGTVIDLRNLKKEKRTAPKQAKFHDISPTEAQKMIAYLQSLFPQLAA